LALDVGQAAGVLAGTVLSLTHGLIQCRIAGLVLGVHSNVIVPICTVNGGHGQAHKERIASAGDHFGNTSLHNEVQALLHVGCRGMTGRIGLSHGNAAVLNSNLQSVLYSGRIGSQCSGQLVVQSIAGEVVDTTLSLVGVRGGQTDGSEHGIAALRAIEAIQHANLTLTVHDLVAHGDVGHFQIRELHTLNGVFAQLINDSIVMQTCGDIRFCVPHAIFAGFGNVVLINGERRLLAGVDGRFRSKCRSHQANGHERRHQQRQYAMDSFHVQFVSFVM